MPHLHKYVPYDVAIVFLQKGISFSRPSDFADKSEFQTRFCPIRVHEFLAAKQMHERFLQNPAWVHHLPPVEQLLWYSQPHPKMSPKSKKLIKAHVNRLNARLKNVSSEKLKHQLNARFRICSLTTWDNSEKMWREYADDSTGVKFTFRTNALIDSILGTLRPITYSPHLPCYNPAYFSRDGEHLLRVIYTKLDSFTDEREVRLCADLWRPQVSAVQGLYTFETIGQHDKQREYLYYRPIQECLSAVTFGRNCPKGARERIIALLNQPPDKDICMQLCKQLRELLFLLESCPWFRDSSPKELAKDMPIYEMQACGKEYRKLIDTWGIMNQLKCQLATGYNKELLKCLQKSDWKVHANKALRQPRFIKVQII